MTKYLTLLISIYAFALAGQHLEYDIELIDVERTPLESQSLEEIFPVANGAFLHHIDGDNERTVSFFNEVSIVDLLHSNEVLSVVGATEEGAYILQGEASGARHLVFLDLNGNLNTLTSEPISFQTIRQFGSSLLVFGEDVGIRRYTNGEPMIIIREQYDRCFSCTDWFFDVEGYLVFPTQDSMIVTDGTREGTINMLFGRATPYWVNGRLILYRNSGNVLSYDPVSGVVNNLAQEHPNIGGSLSVWSWPTVTEHGLLFVGRTSATGAELFITQGTPESTRLLLDINPGEDSGVHRSLSEEDFNVSDGHLIFYGGRDPEDSNIMISDGSAEGTHVINGLIEHPVVNNRLEWFQIGHKLMLLHTTYHTVFHDPDYIYTLNLLNPTEGLVPVDTLDYSLSSVTKFVVGDRLVLRRHQDNLTDEDEDLLYSYGLVPGEPQEIRRLDVRDDTRLVSPNHLMVNLRGNPWVPDTLAFYLGREGRLTSALPVHSSDSSPRVPVELFQTDQGTFIYSFSEDHGESVYSLTSQTPSFNFLADLYPRNAGLSEVSTYLVGEHILFNYHSSSEPYPWQILSAETLQPDTLSVQEGAFTPSGAIYLGSIDGKFYYGSSTFSTPQLTELDIASREINDLTHLLPAEDTDEVKFELLGEKIYVQSLLSLESPQRNTARLLAIDPQQDETTVINTDTISFFAGSISSSMATDGRNLFFSKKFSDGVRPAVYDPSTGGIIPVGHTQEWSEYIFAETRGDIFVDYSRGFNSGSYPVSIAGLGNQFELRLRPSNFPPVSVDSFVFLFRSHLISMDKLTGDSTLLFDFGDNSYGSAINISNREIVFLTTLGGDGTWQIWRSDGTKKGTKQVMNLPPLGGNSAPRVYKFGNYVGLVADDENWLYLFDPHFETLQRVESPPGVSIRGTMNDALYFFANDSIFGREFHRLKLMDPDYLEGVAFYDSNQNGVLDEEEPGLSGVRISVSGDRNGVFYTDAQGFFRVPVKVGESYEVMVSEPSCYETLTSPSTYQLTYHPDSTYQITFGFGSQSERSSLRTLLNSGTIRCGFEHDFWLTVRNDGCQPLAGEGSVYFPEEMEFLGSDLTPLSQEEHTLTFAFDTLQPNASQRIRIRFRMPDENFAGLPVELGAAAGAVDRQGAMITSDTFAYSEILRCAIDPNDKQVSPSRPEPSGSNYTQLDETLRYTIRFQNTGNDTAFTVRIQDRISESLDLETFKPLAASHPYSVSVRGDRTLVFLFEDILLPDSTTNLPGSQGFVTFEINAYPDLDDFSTIDNTAGIYFDFNQPVITNTVTSTLVEFLDEDQDGFLFYEECNDKDFDINPAAAEIPNNGIDENCDELDDFPVATTEALPGTLNYFPNPTSGTLYLNYSENDRLHGELYSAAGKRLRAFEFQNAHNLELEGLPAGLYLLRLYTREGGGATVRVVRR